MKKTKKFKENRPENYHVHDTQITLRQIAKQVNFYIQQPLLPTDTETCLTYHCGKVAVFGAHGVYVLLLDSILDQLGEINLPLKDVSLQNLRRSSEPKPSWPNL